MSSMEFNSYKLSEICEVKSGKRLPVGSNFSDEITNYPYIRARDIKNGKIDSSSLSYIDEELHKKLKRYIINEGDIALTVVANIGDVGYCEKELDNVNLTENAVRLTNFDKNINSRFLTYYLSQPFAKLYMEGLAAGAAQSKLGMYKVNKIKVNVPNLDFQKKIVSIIFNYDQLIENNNKRIKILENMAESLYKEWFVRFRFPGHETAEFENGIPKGWEIKKIKNIVMRYPFGKTYKDNETENEGLTIVIDQSDNKYMGFVNDAPIHKADYEKPLLLFGDHTCKYVLMCENFSLGENIIPYSTNNGLVVNNYYLYYATKNIITTEEYKRHWNRYINFKIFVPDIILQNKFTNIIKGIKQEIDRLEILNRNLAKQRDLLLPRLMSGKLEIK